MFTRYKKNIKLAGIVYLHRITDNRMAGTPHRNQRMFAQLCGDQGLKKVILVTTMWDEVKKSTGANREHELRLHYWKVMMDKGASVARFQNTRETAWEIIDTIVQESSADVLLIQEELVDRKLRLKETKAGIALHSNLELLPEQQRRTPQRKTQHRETQSIDWKVGEESDPAQMEADYIFNERKFRKKHIRKIFFCLPLP